MAFSLQNWSRQTAADNAGQGSQGFGGPAIFTYRSGTDAVAVVAAANYFASQVYELAVKDIIFIRGSDAFAAYEVATLDRAAGTITLASIGLTNAIGTANIIDGSITTAKLANGAVTSLKLDDTLINVVRVRMTDADVQGMYAAPHELVPAPGVATQKVLIHRIAAHENYAGVVFANGGAIGIQYDATVHGAGTQACQTLAAATFIAFVADTNFAFTPVDTTLPDATTLNKSVCISNDTAAFTGGTGTVIDLDVYYSIVDYV